MTPPIINGHDLSTFQLPVPAPYPPGVVAGSFAARSIDVAFENYNEAIKAKLPVTAAYIVCVAETVGTKAILAFRRAVQGDTFPAPDNDKMVAWIEAVSNGNLGQSDLHKVKLIPMPVPNLHK
jgi:hypothetical protein